MEDLLSRTWEQLLGRLEGPLFFRFILQPIMAAFFGVRHGLDDARRHKAPYLWIVLSSPADRPNLLREGWKDVGRVFLLAVILDLAYQLIVFRWVYPLQSLLVAIALAVVPYLATRGTVTRLAAPPWRKQARRFFSAVAPAETRERAAEKSLRKGAREGIRAKVDRIGLVRSLRIRIR